MWVVKNENGDILIQTNNEEKANEVYANYQEVEEVSIEEVMNKYQKIYCDTYYDGKIPNTKVGKIAFEVLDEINIEEIYPKIRVHFPDRVETYVIDELKDNIPEKQISTLGVASNVPFWRDKGYLVEFL